MNRVVGLMVGSDGVDFCTLEGGSELKSQAEDSGQSGMHAIEVREACGFCVDVVSGASREKRLRWCGALGTEKPEALQEPCR